MRGHHTFIIFLGSPIQWESEPLQMKHWGAAGKMPEYDVKPPLGAPLCVVLEAVSRNLFHKELTQKSGV